MRISTYCLAVAVAAIALGAARAGDEKTAEEKLTRLARAAKAYRFLHDGKGPAKVSDLYYENLVEGLSPFTRPGSTNKITARLMIDAQSDYTVAPVKAAPDLFVREKRLRLETGKVLAAFADGGVRLVPLTADEIAAGDNTVRPDGTWLVKFYSVEDGDRDGSILESRWTFTKAGNGTYTAKEHDLGQATGSATYDSKKNVLRLHGETRDKRYIANYEWDMNTGVGTISWLSRGGRSLKTMSCTIKETFPP